MPPVIPSGNLHFNCTVTTPAITFAQISRLMRTAAILSLLLVLTSCSSNNVDTEPGLEKYFRDANASGTFALFNNSTGRFTVYNLDRYKDSAYTPAATFDIVNALIGLQTGVIRDEKTSFKIDSANSPNAGLNLMDAFRSSNLPYFQQAARGIDKPAMQYWLDSLSYGTRKITTSIDSFWLDGSLRLTADEQLGLVKRLYFNQLPFFKYNQEIVKRAMMAEDKPQYKLSYRASAASEKSGVGWTVGWIEENGHAYFFALNLSSANNSVSGVELLKQILLQLGFMKGNK